MTHHISSLSAHRVFVVPNIVSRSLMKSFLALLPLAITSAGLNAATTPTSTSLSVSSKSLASGASIKLSAAVVSNGKAITRGQILFCDAITNNYCVDGSLLGTAQLGTQGTASISRILNPGSHQLFAIFQGTTTNSGSSSQTSKQTVVVNPKETPTVSLNASGSNGSYNLTATVTGHSAAPLTGTISFLNAQNSQALNTATLGSPSISQSFTTQGSYSTGASPIAAAAADLNNDGRADLVVANNNDASISVLLADASAPGTFQPQVKYTVSGVPYGIAIGDFNADGVPDLAIANSTYLSILLGNSAAPGTFQAEATYAIGRGLGSICIGDFNGDGLPDLAMTDKSYSSMVRIALNDATQPGHFLSQSLSTDFGTVAVTSRDVNKDGFADLILVSSSNSRINVLLADAAHPGQFLAAINYPTYFEPTGASVADFNGDGILDIAAIEQSNIVDLFLGDSAHPGQFLSPKEITTNNLSYSSATATDLNGDGLADLALITNGSSNVNVLLADAKTPGQFQPQSNYSTGSGSSVFLTSADFNGDGVPDLAVLDSSNNSVHLLVGSITKVATATAAISASSQSLVNAAYSGNTAYAGAQSCILSLGNLNPTAPVISNLHISAVGSNSATVQWSSNIPTNSMVQYGTTPTPNQYTSWVNLPTTNHSITLTGLQSGTNYNYEVHDVAFSNGCGHWTINSPISSFKTNP